MQWEGQKCVCVCVSVCMSVCSVYTREGGAG